MQRLHRRKPGQNPGAAVLEDQLGRYLGRHKEQCSVPSRSPVRSWQSCRKVGDGETWLTADSLEPLGNIPPAEAEARYYAMLEEPALAA